MENRKYQGLTLEQYAAYAEEIAEFKRQYSINKNDLNFMQSCMMVLTKYQLNVAEFIGGNGKMKEAKLGIIKEWDDVMVNDPVLKDKFEQATSGALQNENKKYTIENISLETYARSVVFWQAEKQQKISKEQVLVELKKLGFTDMAQWEKINDLFTDLRKKNHGEFDSEYAPLFMRLNGEMYP